MKLKIHSYKPEISIDNKKIHLTWSEWKLLNILTSEPERIFLYHELERKMGNIGETSNWALVQTVCRTRRVLKKSNVPDLIKTIRLKGYKFGKL